MSPNPEWLPIRGDSTCFFANDYSGASGDPEKCREVDGANWYSSKTGELRRELPNDNDQPYRPIANECIEDGGYSLSKGSYIDRGSIVGSPCDPVDFCSDPASTDAVVRDHCSDIWSDVSEEEPYVCTGRDSLGHPVVCPGEGEDEGDVGETPILPLPIFGDEEEDGEDDQPLVEDQDQGDNSGEDQGSEQEEDSSDDSGEEEASQPRELFGE